MQRGGTNQILNLRLIKLWGLGVAMLGKSCGHRRRAVSNKLTSPSAHNPAPHFTQDVLRNASFSSSPLPAYTAKYVVYHLCKAGREASQVRLGCGLDVNPGASCHARLTFPLCTFYFVLL